MIKVNNKRWRLKKQYRRTIYAMIGVFTGIICAFRVNAEAPLTNITVEDDRINVEDYEYFKQASVIKVTLPEKLQQIGFSSFEGCSSLSNIDLPGNLSVIDNRAFAKCASLKDVTIPESTVFIGNAAFYGCDNLESIVLPSKLTAISNNLFYSCKKLNKVTIPESVTSIGQQSFYDCKSIETIELPKSLTSIGEGAFYDCSSLKSLTIPDTVEMIGDEAFNGCDDITLVVSEESYAARYAEANGINYVSDVKEVVEQSLVEVKATTKEEIITPDVPATGVNTPYAMIIALLCASVAGYMFINREESFFRG